MRYNIVLIGPPACGKGTQGGKLAEKLEIPIIKPGNLYREHIEQQTELGKLAKEYIEQGDLLPDEYTNQMIKEELLRVDNSEGVIVDGYPRTMGQVEALEDMLEIDYLFFINVSDDVVRQRIKDSERHRADDITPVVEHRLAVYHENYDEILEHYKNKPYFHEINGEQEIEKTFHDILEIMQLD